MVNVTRGRWQHCAHKSVHTFACHPLLSRPGAIRIQRPIGVRVELGVKWFLYVFVNVRPADDNRPIGEYGDHNGRDYRVKPVGIAPGRAAIDAQLERFVPTV